MRTQREFGTCSQQRLRQGTAGERRHTPCRSPHHPSFTFRQPGSWQLRIFAEEFHGRLSRLTSLRIERSPLPRLWSVFPDWGDVNLPSVEVSLVSFLFILLLLLTAFLCHLSSSLPPLSPIRTFLCPLSFPLLLPLFHFLFLLFFFTSSLTHDEPFFTSFPSLSCLSPAALPLPYSPSLP